MSIISTVLEKAVTMPNEELLSFENRLPKSSIIKAFQRDTNNIINEGEMRRLKTALTRPVEIAVMKKKIFRVGSVRQINPTPDVIDTDKIGINWITKEFSFIVTQTLNQNNYISNAMEVRKALYDGILSVMYRHPTNALEKNAATYLAANAWAVPPTSTVPGVTLGTGAYEMPTEDYIINAPVVMNELDLFGPFLDISNIGSLAARRREAMYGKFNDHNAAQYLAEFDNYSSKEIPVAAGAESTHFLAAENSLGLINRIEYDAIIRNDDKDGEFYPLQDPFFGFDWGVYVTKARTDLSGTYGVGNERVVSTRFDFAADFAFVKAYTSVAGESPILKFNTQVS